MWNCFKQLIRGKKSDQCIPDDYFMGAPDEMVSYMEDQGIKACERQEMAISIVRERAYKLVNFLIAGSGGAIVLFLNYEGVALYSKGLLILFAGWSVTAAFLTIKCLFSIKRGGVYGSPDMLYFDWDSVYGKDLTATQKLKRSRLAVYSRTAKSLHKISESVSRSLNASIICSISTVIVCAAYVGYVFLLRPSGV